MCAECHQKYDYIAATTSRKKYIRQWLRVNLRYSTNQQKEYQAD